MSWEYRFLKHQLEIPCDALLTLFESFCERAHDSMDSMEWSWKFHGGRALANRVFWLGAPSHRASTSEHVRWLAGELALNPADLPGGLQAWFSLVEHHTERALVSYAGPSPEGDRSAAIKIYLTLDRIAVSSRLLQAVIPKLACDLPLEAATVLLCYAAYECGDAASRIYLIYGQESFQEVALCEWMRSVAGDRALELARSHVRAGLAFKNDTTNMLGLGFRPSGVEMADHPCWWNSAALVPLFCAAGSRPLLRARLRRVTWITLPLSREALALPLTMPEMNVYVRLR